MQKSACLLCDVFCSKRAPRARPIRVQVGRVPRAWLRAAETQARSIRNRRQERCQVVGGARVAVLTWEQMGREPGRGGYDVPVQLRRSHTRQAVECDITLHDWNERSGVGNDDETQDSEREARTLGQ
jgi:hypothetical protein